MNVLVDENIPTITLTTLREMGHDVADVRGTPDEGVDDDILWRRAQTDRRLLITTDRGFARRRSEPHAGILIVALRQPNRMKIHRRVIDILESVPQETPHLNERPPVGVQFHKRHGQAAVLNTFTKCQGDNLSSFCVIIW